MVVKVIRDTSVALPYYTYIDVSKIVAIDSIDSPQSIETYAHGYHKYKTFTVYCDNFAWEIDISCYDRVLKSWLLVKNKSKRDIELCNTSEDK